MPHVKYAVFGGVYNNWLALEATLDDAARRGCADVHCLGDLGGFGPHPDRVFPILLDAPDARLADTLAASLGPIRLRWSACKTCVVEGLTCRT